MARSAPSTRIWTIDSKTLGVEDGQDLIDPTVRYFDYATHSCSERRHGAVHERVRLRAVLLRLPDRARRAVQPGTKRGYEGQIYFANEETGDMGRVFGVTKDGQAPAAATSGPVLAGEHPWSPSTSPT